MNVTIIHKLRSFFAFPLALVFCFVVSSCSDDFESPATPQGSTIAAIASDSEDFNILIAALTKTGLATTLNNNNSGQFTVFAPNDVAFLAFLQSSSAFNVALTEEEAIAKINTLTNTTPSSSWNLLAFASRLNYHIVSSEIKSNQITGKQVFTTLSTPSTTSGQARLSLSVVGTDVLVNANTTANGAKIIAFDMEASNGVIHTIDRVLTAPSTSTALSFLSVTINYAVIPAVVTVSTTAGNYNVLAAAIKRAEIATILQPNVSPLPDFTIFAPTDAAFIAYLGVADEAAAITAINGKDKAALASLLMYHVISGRVLSTDLSDEQVVNTLQTGNTFTMNITGNVYTLKDKRDADESNDPTISAANTLTNAGVVHTLNSVLRPIPD